MSAAALNPPAAPPIDPTIPHSKLVCGGCGQIRAGTGIRGKDCGVAICDACIVGLATCALLKDTDAGSSVWCISACAADSECFTLPTSIDGIEAWHRALPRDDILEATTTHAAKPAPLPCEFSDACSKPATRVCISCDCTKFCDDCWRNVHSHSKRLAAHVPKTLAEAGGAMITENCNKHAMPRVWWCTVDQRLVCLACRDACTESGHKVSHMADQQAALLGHIEATVPALKEAGEKAKAHIDVCHALGGDIDVAEAAFKAAVAAHKQALLAAVEEASAEYLRAAEEVLAARRSALLTRSAGSTNLVAFSQHLHGAADATTAGVGVGVVTMQQLAEAARQLPAALTATDDAEAVFAAPPTHSYLKLVDSVLADLLTSIKTARPVLLAPQLPKMSAPRCIKVTCVERGAAAAVGGAAVGGAAAGAAAARVEPTEFSAQRWTLRLEWDPLIVPAAVAAASCGFTALPLTFAVHVDGARLLDTVATTGDVSVMRLTEAHLSYKVRIVPWFGAHALEASPEVSVSLGQLVTFRLWGAGGAAGVSSGDGQAGGAGGFAEGKYMLMPGEKLSITVGEAGSSTAAVVGGGGRGAPHSGYASGGGGGASYITSSSRGDQVLLGAGGGGGGATCYSSGGGGGGTLQGRVGEGGAGATNGHGNAVGGSFGGGGGGGTHSCAAPVTAGGAAGGDIGYSGGDANGAGGKGRHDSGGGGGGAASHMHLVHGSFRVINATGHAAVVVPQEPGVTAGGGGTPGRRGAASASASVGLAVIIMPDGSRKQYHGPGVHHVVFDL